MQFARYTCAAQDGFVRKTRLFPSGVEMSKSGTSNFELCQRGLLTLFSYSCSLVLDGPIKFTHQTCVCSIDTRNGFGFFCSSAPRSLKAGGRSRAHVALLAHLIHSSLLSPSRAVAHKLAVTPFRQFFCICDDFFIALVFFN